LTLLNKNIFTAENNSTSERGILLLALKGLQLAEYKTENDIKIKVVITNEIRYSCHIY